MAHTLYRLMGVAAASVAGGVLISRLLGLVRQIVFAWLLGAGATGDEYFVAFLIPDLLNYLLAGAYMAITLIPLLTRRLAGGDEGAARSRPPRPGVLRARAAPHRGAVRPRAVRDPHPRTHRVQPGDHRRGSHRRGGPHRSIGRRFRLGRPGGRLLRHLRPAGLGSLAGRSPVARGTHPAPPGGAPLLRSRRATHARTVARRPRRATGALVRLPPPRPGGGLAHLRAPHEAG